MIWDKSNTFHIQYLVIKVNYNNKNNSNDDGDDDDNNNTNIINTSIRLNTPILLSRHKTVCDSQSSSK
jgi:hypothetical protein